MIVMGMRADFLKRLGRLGIVSAGMLLGLSMAANAQGWKVGQGKLKGLGANYASGTVRQGETIFSLSCRSDFQDITANFMDLPMPKATLVDGAEARFVIHFDLGAGVAVRMPINSSYYAADYTWTGGIKMDAQQFEAFGTAKQIVVTRPDGKVAARFPAKGSRKVERAIRKHCFPNVR